MLNIKNEQTTKHGWWSGEITGVTSPGRWLFIISLKTHRCRWRLENSWPHIGAGAWRLKQKYSAASLNDCISFCTYLNYRMHNHSNPQRFKILCNTVYKNMEPFTTLYIGADCYRHFHFCRTSQIWKNIFVSRTVNKEISRIFIFYKRPLFAFTKILFVKQKALSKTSPTKLVSRKKVTNYCHSLMNNSFSRVCRERASEFNYYLLLKPLQLQIQS
jgi:hypothetical protein